MIPISAGWPDVNSALANMEPVYAQRIMDLTASLDFNRLTVYLNNLHDKSPCRIIEDRYTWGQSFVVFEAVFPNMSWVIRVAMMSLSSDPKSRSAYELLLRKKMLNETIALEIVHDRTSIPVPHIIVTHTTSSTNPLGLEAPAFMVMTSMEGMHMSMLGVDMANPDPTCGDGTKLPVLTNYFYDLADIHVQLSGITFPLLGSFTVDDVGDNIIGPSIEPAMGPFNSSTAYFCALADHFDQIASVDSSNSEVDRLKKQFVAFMWRSAVLPLVDTLDGQGPFPLRHGDLHVDNILVDAAGHIVGLIDWDNAATVPWEVFAVPGVDTSAFFVNCLGTGKSKADMFPPRHAIFNRALKARQKSSPVPSRKTLSELHDSTAAHIGAYLALFMASMECDYRFVGRSLYHLLGWGEDIDEGFTKFLTTRGYRLPLL
jgi:hypothetical protein